MSKRIFISYSHTDQPLLDRLHKHLSQLQRDGTISEWYDREIHAGGKINEEVNAALEAADIFIACASPDYIASNYCYERELNRALQREKASEIAIVPVIFEPCEWLETPLAQFKAVPHDGKAVAEYTNQNLALLEVATELRRLANRKRQPCEKPARSAPDGSSVPRESRYRVRRDFDAVDKRDFVERSYQDIYRFFEASARELEALPDIEARLSPFEPDSFFCTIINRGFGRGFETIHVRRGGTWGAIDYLFGEQNSRTTSNGGFSVEADEYQLHLKSSDFGYGSGTRENLAGAEAGQLLWDELLKRVGIDYA